MDHAESGGAPDSIPLARPVSVARPGTGAKNGPKEVPQSEGNEAMREGNQGVGVPRSTEEAGEPPPAGPGGGKGALAYGTVGGKHEGHIEAR